MRKLVKSAGLVLLGVVLAGPLFFGSMKLMVATSTPEFCASCHEIQPAVQAWRMSSHVNNPKGLRATCMDCHLPPPEDTFNFFVMKAYHGTKDVIGHLRDGAENYDVQKARANMYAEVNNETCLRCHENVLFMPDKRGAMLAHRSVLYPRPGMEKKCVDCHYDLVHTARPAHQYSQTRAVPYQAKGLRTLYGSQL
ncbi:MAG TPA: NapC/NirT family cytochrome c [Desulfomicrobiaceae bacterium]|nr:NapC/NirT family cytochrome c [Desulfomicrobiaceae bacterium]